MSRKRKILTDIAVYALLALLVICDVYFPAWTLGTHVLIFSVIGGIAVVNRTVSIPGAAVFLAAIVFLELIRLRI